MQTTHKIDGESATGFASYLTATTRGDYYLADTGVDQPPRAGARARGGLENGTLTADAPTALAAPAPGPLSPPPHASPHRPEGETPGGGRAGRWHGSPEALAALGLSHNNPVTRDELLSLMRGCSPATGEPIRAAGANGTRVAGVDLTFSAPKSVSALWAVSSPYRRAQIEAAHGRAVRGATERMEREVQLMRRRVRGELRFERTASVIGAEFVHTSSRLTAEQERGGVPDPQLHSHVVVLAGQRIDGRFGAVESRELFRAARANGAWYRGELAHHLKELGLEVQGRTGREGRYFELKGIPPALVEQWSARTADIERAARAFHRRYGREPRAGELGALTVATRGTKTRTSQTDVSEAWRAVAAEHGLTRADAASLFDAISPTPVPSDETTRDTLARDVLADVTRTRSTIPSRDLRARAYELAAGTAHPATADEVLADLVRERELIPLQNDLWTTRQLREREQRTLETAASRAQQPAAPVSRAALHAAQRETERDLGARLSDEQREALATITGGGGVTVLVGQAGTGKGVVLKTAASAWREQGNEVIGTAVAGATAQRLQADANLDRSMTTDSLLAKAERGTLNLNDKTVVIMDEAGMADTNRLARLTELTAETDSKLVLVGDSAQLSPIGAGGLFGDLQQTAPSAELSEVYRAREEWERTAWSQIRAGESARALAAYRAHDRLHITDTRDRAAHEMIDAWDRARLEHGAQRVTMLTDASNRELDEINAEAQARRDARGELGTNRVELPDRPYALASGDEIIFTAPHYRPDEQRVENGTLAEITNTHDNGTLTVRTHEPTPRELNLDTNEFTDLKLAYAQHVYKAQGQTVDRAFVLTGGWQTDRERAYVATTRARDSTDIYATREDLGEDGIDTTTIDRLADTIAKSNAQRASIAHPEATPEPPSLDHARERDDKHRQRTPDRDPPTPDRESEAARILRESQGFQRGGDRDAGL